MKAKLISSRLRTLFRRSSCSSKYIYFLKVCTTAAGRNDRGTKEFATVDWMAYQGAPNGGVAGYTRIPEWWTGTKCVEISLPKVSMALCSLKL